MRYIPDLAESIYSLFIHIKNPGHGLSSSFDKGLFIQFPGFETKALIGQDDIYLDATPVLHHNVIEAMVPVSTSPIIENDLGVCRTLTDFQSELVEETTKLDNILRQLRRYYQEVKTKRQLGLDVPAGFRSDTSLQSTFREFQPPRRSKSSSDQMDSSLLDRDLLSSLNNTSPPSDTNFSAVNDHTLTPSPELAIPVASDTISNTSIVRSVDKVSSSLPNKMLMSEDYIKSSVGFRRIDTLRKHFSSLYSDNVVFDNTPPDAFIDAGELATMRKKDRNTIPVTRPLHFADVFHMDIVFGPEISIGNIHYGLLFTDRFSRMTYLYPLQNLTTDIKKKMETFFAHIGCVPKRLVSDFDTKLIGGQAREYLNSLLIHVNASPSNRQDKKWSCRTPLANNGFHG